MKTFQLIFTLTTLLFFNCGESQNKEFSDFKYDSDSEANFETSSLQSQEQASPQKTSNSNKIKGYVIKSKQFGINFGVMPIPESWKEVNNKKDNVLFEGPNGIKIYGEQSASFYFSNNQQQNYYAQQSGNNIKPVKNINQLINQDFKPFLKSKGIQYVGQFPLPQLAQFYKHFDSQLFKSTPENKQYQCVVTEWADDKGNKSMGVIKYYVNQYTAVGGLDWGYTFNAMEAPNSVYEQAKKDYINALLNFKINPQWIQVSNQYYAQLSQQSSANHQQRMADIRKQGQIIRNTGNTYSSILDDSHESWKRRNGMNDAGHSNTVNSGIWERSTVSNPNTGQSYQVEGQNDYYYGNNNNEYIGTDNALYDPNLDQNLNYQDWTEFEVQN